MTECVIRNEIFSRHTLALTMLGASVLVFHLPSILLLIPLMALAYRVESKRRLCKNRCY